MGKRKTTLTDCHKCNAKCCHNLSMHIGRPVTKSEIEDLKWQLQFDTVRVYIRHHRWYQLVDGKCMYLDKDYRCTIYDKRPKKCRDYNPPDCELNHKFYDIMFETPDDLEKYLKKSKKYKNKT
ncbi:MAG: YkgJ family cysteine cluster protein [Candidatus Omnitrophota bacterium]|jgi:Fe-S-cluster containining protein